MSIQKKGWFIGLSFLLSIALMPLYNLFANVEQPTALPYQGVSIWNSEIVADNAKRNGSISITSDDNPAIVYESNDNSEQLIKYAVQSEDQWQITTIDGISFGTPSASFALDNNNIPHVSYAECQNPDCIAKYSIKASSTWTVTQHLDGYGSLAIGSNNEVHIGYHHGNSENVRHMSLDGASWITTTIDTDTNYQYTCCHFD